MVNGYLIFNRDKKLVPDTRYNGLNEQIELVGSGYYYSPTKLYGYYLDLCTFENTSIIRMLLSCAKKMRNSYHDAIEIKIHFTDALRHEVIRFDWHHDFCDSKFYHIFPHEDKIRIVTSMEDDDMLDLYNPIYIDLDRSTHVKDLINIFNGDRSGFIAFPKFMRNILAYSDITFEFVAEEE